MGERWEGVRQTETDGDRDRQTDSQIETERETESSQRKRENNTCDSQLIHWLAVKSHQTALALSQHCCPFVLHTDRRTSSETGRQPASRSGERGELVYGTTKDDKEKEEEK